MSIDDHAYAIHKKKRMLLTLNSLSSGVMQMTSWACDCATWLGVTCTWLIEVRLFDKYERLHAQ